MARRTVRNTICGNASVRVTYDPDLSEYRSRLSIGGKSHPSADYFTSDKQDALITADVMVAINAWKESV